MAQASPAGLAAAAAGWYLSLAQLPLPHVWPAQAKRLCSDLGRALPALSAALAQPVWREAGISDSNTKMSGLKLTHYCMKTMVTRGGPGLASSTQ